MRDLSSNIKTASSINAVAAGTTGTGQVGAVVDRKGYDGVTFINNFGAITATNATMTLVIKEGDVTGTMTSVADADLIGTELGASIIAGTPRADGGNENLATRIGYIGGKRYVSANIVNTVTAATPVASTVILSHPNQAPVLQSDFS